MKKPTAKKAARFTGRKGWCARCGCFRTTKRVQGYHLCPACVAELRMVGEL